MRYPALNKTVLFKLELAILASIVLFSLSAQSKYVKIQLNEVTMAYNHHVGNEWLYNASLNGHEITIGETYLFEITQEENTVRLVSEMYEVSETYNDYGYSQIQNSYKGLKQGKFDITERVVVTEHHGRYAGNSAAFDFYYSIEISLNEPGIHPANVNVTYNESKNSILERFFGYINNGQLSKAYELTENEKWTPYENFVNGWKGFSNIKLIKIEDNNYENQFDAEVLSIEYEAFDKSKGIRRTFKFDFLLKYSGYHYKIVRMLYHKGDEVNAPWYSKDPMYNSDKLELIRLVNKPFALIQDYYDNFVDRNQVKSNTVSFYSSVLLIHFEDQLITSEDANYKDYSDFDKNEVKSYKIFVQPYDMITQEYDQFSIVYVPVNFYIEFNNGKKTKYSSDIYTILNEDKTKIIGINNQIISIDDIIQILEGID